MSRGYQRGGGEKNIEQPKCFITNDSDSLWQKVNGNVVEESLNCDIVIPWPLYVLKVNFGRLAFGISTRYHEITASIV
jgi:hypothetical protein